VAAVVAGRPDHDGFRRYVEGFKGSKTIKGIRRVLHVPETSPGTCLSEAFVKGIRLLGTLGLSFDLCLKPGEIPNATKLLDACPDTRFILDHCGNPDVKLRDLSDWKKSIDEMAKRKNVVCKVSGFIVHAPRDKWTAELLAPVVHHVCDSFGPDRVMFGGDWPVCTLTATYRQWVDALKQIVKGKPELDQKKLFHDNAVRFYGL
jgi:predicted TIM-barrel fold metal-dependent hydrolase